MTQLTILEYPDPRLRTKAQPVAAVDDRIRQLIDDMFETMYAAPGIGLAATQVDVHERVVTIDISEDGSEPLALINPEIVAKDGIEKTQEGCLSVPGIFENVERADWIKLAYLDRDGQPQSLEADGLLAVCIQHECDHLDGKLFVDYLSSLKRNRARKRLQKQQAQQQAQQQVQQQTQQEQTVG